MTCVEQILASQPGATLNLVPDLCLLNDDLSHALPELPDGIASGMGARTLTVLDHDIPAGSFATAFRQKALIDLSKKYDLPFVQAEGIGYALLCETYLRSGQLFLGWGDHTCAVGAVGALGLQLTDEALACVLEQGIYHYSVPEKAALRFTGALPVGTIAYDAALSLLPNKVEEGKLMLLTDGTDTGLELEAKRILCQMLQRFGAAGALFLPDGEMASALAERQVETCCLSKAVPFVVPPGGMSHICPGAEATRMKVDACFIGGCCGGNLGDLRRAADILRGNYIHRELRLTVSFISNQVYLQAMKEGLVEVFLDSGAQVTNPGCSSCRTTSIGVVGDGEVLVSTGCYNYPGCCGTPASQVYLASAETAAHAALTGSIQA